MNIELDNINCFYGSHHALKDINLTCSNGEIVVLLGPSGAGKSSLLRVLNLLELPTSGTFATTNILFDFTKSVPKEKEIRMLRQNVGMVFQQYHLWPHMTIMENLITAPRQILKLSKVDAVNRAKALLTRLQLSDFADRYPLQLSGGQQQRIAISRALMMQPSTLLFDEPTAALDPEITAQVIDIIKELAQTGITQVIVTHEVDFAKKIASHVVYMENGQILEQGDHHCFTNPKTEAFAHYLSH